MLSLKSAFDRLKAEIDPRKQKDLASAHAEAVKALEANRLLSVAVGGKSPPVPSAPSSVNGDDASSQTSAASRPSSSASSSVVIVSPSPTGANHSPIQHEYPIWKPFKLALNPTTPVKLREVALDLVQKLAASALLRGSELQPSGSVEPSPGGDKDSQQPSLSYPPLLIDEIVQTVCLASPLTSFSDASTGAAESNVHLQIIKCLLTLVTTTHCEVHETSLLKTLQVCFNISLYSKNPINQSTARAGITQIIHYVFSSMETMHDDLSKAQILPDIPRSASATSNGEQASPMQRSASIPDITPSANGSNNPYFADDIYAYALAKRDAYLTMRFLFRLSVKTDTPPANAPKVAETADLSTSSLRVRTIAMEMVLMVLNNAGTVMKSQDPFISFIRQYITISVSKNGLQTHPPLFELAFSTFLILIKTYNSHLKNEIEILFNEIYLYILDNSNSSFKQKSILLTGLFKLCSSPQIMVDTYLNYDCDMAMASVFERIVTSLEKTTKGSGVKVNTTNNQPVGVFGVPETQLLDPNAQHERTIRAKALRCLTALVISIRQWVKESNIGNGLSNVVAAQDMATKALDSAVTSTETSPVSNNNIQSPPDGELNSPPSNAPVINGKRPLQALNMESIRSSRSSSDVEYSTSSTNILDLPEEAERVKTKKSILKQGIALFIEKPNKGFALLRKNGFLADDASVISFLRNTPELDKKSIGDFLGDGDAENIRLMHCFIDSFDFSNVDFVISLRRLLQNFRLPGEAQKIDRIMEKFAARYCETNQKIFAKADAAYTLAFSIMMLNTDLHSTRIKKKMTKADFIRNNRGINESGDLPDEFLSRIFDNIEGDEIIMEEERTVKELEKMLNGGLLASRELEDERTQLFKRETRQIEKKSQTLIKKGKERSVVPFKSATHVDHGRPMFEILWPSLMASLSTVFEECSADDFPIEDDKAKESAPPDMSKGVPEGANNVEIIHLCLWGFNNAIRIACLFKLATERDAFMSSLGKISGLRDISTMKSKNVAAAKALISIAFKMGNQLDSSWTFIIQCVSDLDKWHLIGEGSVIEGFQNTHNDGDATLSPTTEDLKSVHARRPSLHRLTEQFSSNQMTLMIDRIFSRSVQLDGSSIVNFYKALCEVSIAELEASRIYCLQKVVEISYYNMGRIRLEWSQIWKILTRYFENAGCHPNARVSTFVVDSLRQLGMKFLERDELAHFNTNNEFLKPFEHIIRFTIHPVIRDLVVSSIYQMVSARASNIKSGWRTIFMVLSRISTEHQDEALLRRSFEFHAEVLPKYWEFMSSYLVDYANCCVDYALIDPNFTTSGSDSIVDKAIALLVLATDKLSEDALKAGTKKLSEDDFFLKWFPILSGLSRIQQDSHAAPIRARSLDAFFGLLEKHGHFFSFADNHWKTVIKSVILPVFEDLKLPVPQRNENDPISEQERIHLESGQSAIWIQAIRRMMDVYSLFYLPAPDSDMPDECFKKSPELLKELLDLLLMLIGRNSQNLAHTGVVYTSEFIRSNMEKFDNVNWDIVVSFVEEVFSVTIPTELMLFPMKQKKTLTDVDAEKQQTLINSIDVPHAILKCATHLLVLELVRDLCLITSDPAVAIIKGFAPTSAIEPLPSQLFRALDKEYQNRLLSCLNASLVFARSFNDNYELRLALWKANAVPQMPYLIKQESMAHAIYISLLFHHYRQVGDNFNDSSEPHDGEKSILRHPQATSNMKYRTRHLTLDTLVTECKQVLERYITFYTDSQKYSKEILNWQVVISLIWREILATRWGLSQQADDNGISTELFKQHIPALFRLAIQMMVVVERTDVRECIKDFMERLALVMDKPEFKRLL